MSLANFLSNKLFASIPGNAGAGNESTEVSSGELRQLLTDVANSGVWTGSLVTGSPTDTGKLGTLPPPPGAQRLIGLPTVAGVDPSINRVLGQALCAIATVTSQIKTTNQVDFSISGQVFRKAATDNFWTLTGGVQPISSFRKYLLCVDSTGTASVVQSLVDSTVSAALAVLPSPPAGKTVFGVATIATNGATTFTPGTTLLGAAGITTTIVDGLDSFYAPLNAPPTITRGVAGAGSVITNAVLTGATINSSGTFILNPNIFWKYLCGSPIVVGQVFPTRDVVAPSSCNGIQYSGGYAVEFEFDGSQFEFKSYAQAGAYYRLMVDGQYVGSSVPVADGVAGQLYWYLVDFNGVRANRRIRLEFAPYWRFGGINTGPLDTMWPSSIPSGPRVAVFGDSFSIGTGTDGPSVISGYHDTMAKLLGWRDVWPLGLGGTGYLAPGTTVKLRDRVQTDVININPDIVIVAAGYNDNPTYTQAAVQAEATLLFAAIRAGLPNVKLIVVEQWSANGSPSANTLAYREAIRTAWATDPGPKLFIDTMVTTVAGANTLGWITGTGHIGATTGSGNADLYVASDGIHPSQAGHNYYGRRFASSIGLGMPF